MCRMVLAWVVARSVRAIYLVRSWPNRALRILQGGAIAARTIAQLRSDYQVYMQLRAKATQNTRAATLEKRSIFRLTPVLQLVEGLRGDDGEWRSSRTFEDWLRRKTLRIGSSILCEDAFNIQKNSNVVKSKRRYMAPHKAAVVVLDKRAAGVGTSLGGQRRFELHPRKLLGQHAFQ